MASQLLYLGLLFTMTLTRICAQGTDNNEGPKIDLGLSLVPAPHIILVQQKMKTPVLLNCSLNVTDQNLLPLSYKWLKDGQQIDLIHPKPKMQLLPNGSLLLQPRRNKSKNRTLDGIYDCLVTTSTKNVVIARRVKVVVASIAKNNSSKEQTSKEAYKGGVARFECNIRAEPVASYIWHRNDTQLPQDDERFSSLLSGVLQISNIDLNDAGLYWCQATTYLFTSQEQIANFSWKKGRHVELKVKADSGPRPPVLLASPQNINVIAGETAEFECFADGNPTPTVAWRKIDSDVVFGPQKLSWHGNLRLVQVTPEDAGVYECTVSGQGPILKASATLTVLEPPKLEQGPDSYMYPVSRVLFISCKVTGNPPPKISWYHNGVPISETDIYSEIRDIKNGQTLYLYTLQKKNAGFYQCVAQNSVGQVMAVALLKIIKTAEAPPLPSNVKCTALSSTSFEVTWDHAPSGSHPYIVSYQIVGDTKPPTQEFCPPNYNENKQKCNIFNRLPYTNYSVRVQAYSMKGASDMTEKVYVRTQEDVPKTIPVFSVTSPQFHSLLVSWTPLTIEESRGRVVLYKIYYRTADKRDDTSKEVSGNRTSYLITGLEPNTEYEVLVIAATSKGYPTGDNWPWTKCVTPPANASSPPRMELKYINATAVWLEWQAPASSSTPTEDLNITGYSLELHSMLKVTEPVKMITLPASVRSYILTDLDNEQFYRVTLSAVTKQGSTSPSTSEFQLKELQFQLVPSNVHADSVLSNSVSISWTNVLGINVKYEVCFRKELDKSDRLCKTSSDTSLTVSDLESFTRYEFIVRAVMDEVRAADSKNLIVQTTEDRPSPPMNLTAKVQQNSVQLHWLPPTKPNGVITHYVIMYSKDTVKTDDIVWKTITQKGAETFAQLDDLESGRYLFKLTAGNKAGLSEDTDIVTAVPMCRTLVETSCSLVTETTKDSIDVTGTSTESSVSKLTEVEIGIIVGCVVGLILLILLVIVIRHFCHSLRSCAREQDPNASHSPIYCGNGHISNISGQTGQNKPGNGHAHHISNSPGGYRHEEINMHESTPMLKQIPENEHSDSKGGPDGIPNGVIPNGVVKDSQKIISQIHYSLSPDLNGSNNSEELQGLMAAMLASVDRHNTLGKVVGEKIPMSTFDDIDRSDYLGDNTSQDSGMGGRHAGMLGSKDMIHTSPASSPGESSLGRHQQGWEMGREVDEIGGVFIDRSTGAVIGEVSPRSRTTEKEEVTDEKVARGKHSEDAASNDRDSGHGSESKSHGGVLNSAGDDSNTSFGLSLDVPMSTSPTDMQSEELVASELPPPPPPPPPLFMSPSTPLSSSVSSSQQLPCSKNKNVPNNSRPQNRHVQWSARQNISHTDLPPPPPPPPISPTLPPFQRSLAAVTASTAAATAELNSSGSSIEEGGQQQLNDGSKLPRQSEGHIMVAFSPAPPPSTPPHIA